MSGVWKRPGRGLADIDVPASTNLARPEHGDAPKPRQEPVQARKPETVGGEPKVRPGSVRPPEGRKGSADYVDWRALNATERWVQLSTRITYACNDKIRRIAVARKDAGQGRTKLCEILEDMADLMADKEGIK